MDVIENPRAYARRAAINYLIKTRERGLRRITERLIERGDIPQESDLDPGLLVWEQQEWVTLLLKSLSRPSSRCWPASSTRSPARDRAPAGENRRGGPPEPARGPQETGEMPDETGHHEPREEAR